MRAKRASYHHGDLRRALLDATLELLMESGAPGELTLREVARRAGVSHNAPYRHFTDMAEMLAALAEEGFRDLAAALGQARAAAKEGEERFVQTGLAYLRFARATPGHVAVMFGPHVAKSRTPDLQRAANDTFQVLKQMANDAGVTEGMQARRLGVVVWSFLHGLTTLAANQQVPTSVGTSPEALAELGLRRLFCSFAETKRSRP